jgi:hypothetical protein
MLFWFKLDSTAFISLELKLIEDTTDTGETLFKL